MKLWSLGGAGADERFGRGRWRGWLQGEDLLVVTWLALGEPLLERLLARWLPADLPGYLDAHRSPWLGLLLVGAAGAAAVCLATRDVTEGKPEENGWRLTPGGYARLPMIVTLTMLAEGGLEQLGSDAGEGLLPWIAGLAGGSLLLQGRLPVLPYLLRRLLMLPTVVLGTVLFSATMESMFGGERLRALVYGGGGTEVAAAQLGATIVVVATLFYYALFVFAPRQVAAGEGSWLAWAARFLLFLGAVLVSLVWGAPLPHVR